MKILVPSLGESVTEATVAKWLKNTGETVSKDEVLVELETDKATLEVYAQSNGVLSEIYIDAGQDVEIGAELAEFLENENIDSNKVIEEVELKSNAKNETKKNIDIGLENEKNKKEDIIDSELISSRDIKRSGIGNKITKSDIEEFIIGESLSPSQRRQDKLKHSVNYDLENKTELTIKNSSRVAMTRVQKTMAERLKLAQNNAAMLTTFNEVDMSEVISMRNQYKEEFQNKYSVKLGFMSFFVKACVIGLKNFPAVNAEIQGEEIVYKNYYNISIAVGTDRGLVVPVLRETDEMSFADIEKNIGKLGEKARDGKITIDDLQGGTFTITNGGIYGSMLSTPILNPPQSAVLGMHNIIQRPIVVDGNVEVRPIMYLALSYDHRIIDGKEAVSFLKIVKDSLEQPKRLFLNI